MSRSVRQAPDYAGIEPKVRGLQEFQRIYGKELRAFRPALADRATKPTNILAAGTSMTEGAGASTKSKRWLDILVAELQNQFRLGGVGYIPMRQGVATTYANPWTHAGTPVLTEYGWGLGRRGIYQDSTDDISTITQFCDRFYILWTSSTIGGTFKVTVDGVVVGTQNTNDAITLSGRIWDSGQLPRGTHTISVTPNAASNTCILDGAMFFDTDVNIGVHMWDSSHSGYLAAHFNGSTAEDATAPANNGKRKFWADHQFQPTGFSTLATVSANGTTTLTWPGAHGFDANDVGEVVFTGTDIVAFPKGVRLVSVTDTTHIVVNKAITAGSYGLRVTRDRVTTGTTTVSLDVISCPAWALNPWDEGKTISGTNIPANTYIKQVLSPTSCRISNLATAGTAGTCTFQIKNRRKYSTNAHVMFMEYGFNEEQNSVPKSTYKADEQAVYQTAIDGAQIDLPSYTGIVTDETPSVVLLGLWAHAYKNNTNNLVNITGGTTISDPAGVSNRFVQSDVGLTVSGAGITGGTTISAVPALSAGQYYATSATLSAPATNASGVTIAISGRQWQDSHWQDFRDGMAELAAANSWAFMDIYSLAEWIGVYDLQRLTYEGIHPNDRGQRWIADEATHRFAGSSVYGATPQGIYNNPGEMLIAQAADLPVVKPGIKRMTAQVVTAATANTMSDLTELAFPVGPNETISFMINLIFTAAAATTGLVFDLNPSTNMSAPAALSISTWAPASASTFTVLGRSDAAYGTDMIGTGGGGTVPTLMQIIGTVTGGAYGGTLTPRAAPEVAAAVTVLRGSWLLAL